MSDREYRTSEVARIVGVEPDVLRKWKYRGFLRLAPQSTVGRHNEMIWTQAAVDEVIRWSQAERINRPPRDEGKREGDDG